jgi:hypothetical protein
MNKDDLLAKLKQLQIFSIEDEEVAHYDADMALLEYINDPEIKAAFEAIRRWYA